MFKLNIQKDEECLIEDNTQRIKWKISKSNSQSDLVPSVCFTLPPVDEDSVDIANQLKSRHEHLLQQVKNCQLQLKKDRLFSLMSTIKFCELDEYVERKASKNTDLDLDLLLSKIKSDLDKLVHEANSCENSDMKVLIESYEKCCKKLNDLNEKSLAKDECEKLEKQVNSDMECLQLKLNYLNEKSAQLRNSNSLKENANKMDNFEKLLTQNNVNIFIFIFF